MNAEELFNVITSNGMREMTFERFKQAVEEIRVDENEYWYKRAYSQPKGFDGFCEQDFQERISEINRRNVEIK